MRALRPVHVIAIGPDWNVASLVEKSANGAVSGVNVYD
jgi:hypothetical protein